MALKSVHSLLPPVQYRPNNKWIIVNGYYEQSAAVQCLFIELCYYAALSVFPVSLCTFALAGTVKQPKPQFTSACSLGYIAVHTLLRLYP